MTNLAHLQETRAAKAAELRNAVSDPARFDAIDTEIRKLDADIARVARVDALDKAASAAANPSIRASDLEGYSIHKAISEAADGNVTGLEREISAELGNSRSVRGVMIPTSLIFGEQRAQTVGTPSAGGYTVATNLGPMIDRLRPALKVQQMGATVISGLVGNLDLPRLASGPSATWIAEDGTSTESSSTFEKIGLKPRTVSGEMYMSRRMQLQNSVSLEGVLRSDLAYVLAQALDTAAINGTGVNDPKGILTTITEHATAETELSDIAADLIAALELDDVTGTTGFLTNAALLAKVRKIKDQNLRTIPVSEIFHGERVESSNNVPAVTAKNPLIFGAWSNLVIGYWSGVDILANPYSDATKGGLRLHAFLDADIALRHNEAFAYKLVA